MSAAPAACPRCRSATVEPLCDSPVAGVWTLYRCKTCLYAWRSTEPEENTNPDKYPAAFRLSPDDVANFPIVFRAFLHCGRNEHAACSLPSASATCRPGVYRRPKEKPTPPRGMVSGGSLISAFGIKRAIRGFDTLEALGGFRDRPSNREIIGLAFDY